MSQTQSQSQIPNDDDYSFTMGSGNAEYCPVGIYQCEFLGVERKPKSQHNGKEMAEAIQFRFKVIGGGPHDGKLTSNMGPPTPTPNNVTGKLLFGLIGKELKPNENANLKDCVGKRYTCTVMANRNGRPVVIMCQKIT